MPPDTRGRWFGPADLSGVDLRGLDLTRTDLQKARLAHAHAEGVVVHGALALEHRAAIHQRLDQGGLARAVGAQQSDAVACAELEAQLADDLVLPVAQRGAFQLQQLLRLSIGLDEAEAELGIHVRGRNLDHALEHLQAALCLPGLVLLVAETFHVALHVADLLLLINFSEQNIQKICLWVHFHQIFGLLQQMLPPQHINMEDLVDMENHSLSSQQQISFQQFLPHYKHHFQML